ncbi:hypothetical protein EAE99_006447 [Botrytis elliptica]|nr:hypothetical protein EAE99_006447 [Botrytis elliptica]
MAHLPPNINFDSHEREAMANFVGQNVYSTRATTFGYANLQIYNSEAAARLRLTEEMFTIHDTVAADINCYRLHTSFIKISGRFGIIICEPGMIGSMVHLNAVDERIILKPECRIGNNVYIGPGVVIGLSVHVCENVRIAGSTEINSHASVGQGVSMDWNVRIGVNVVIGHDVIIGKNVVIEASAIIEMGVVIENDVRIGACAKILRHRRIRAGTRVEENSTYGL